MSRFLSEQDRNISLYKNNRMTKTSILSFVFHQSMTTIGWQRRQFWGNIWTAITRSHTDPCLYNF